MECGLPVRQTHQIKMSADFQTTYSGLEICTFYIIGGLEARTPIGNTSLYY